MGEPRGTAERPSELAIVIATVVGAAIAIAATIHLLGARGEPAAPRATGEVGALRIYGQLPAGPALLRPFTASALPHPQVFGMTFSARGTGPRRVIVELIGDGAPRRLLDRELFAPMADEPLTQILDPGPQVPPRFELVVRVFAPHADPIESRYTIALTGRE